MFYTLRIDVSLKMFLLFLHLLQLKKRSTKATALIVRSLQNLFAQVLQIPVNIRRAVPKLLIPLSFFGAPTLLGSVGITLGNIFSFGKLTMLQLYNCIHCLILQKCTSCSIYWFASIRLLTAWFSFLLLLHTWHYSNPCSENMCSARYLINNIWCTFYLISPCRIHRYAVSLYPCISNSSLNACPPQESLFAKVSLNRRHFTEPSWLSQEQPQTSASNNSFFYFILSKMTNEASENA